jgi:hypothetical protein
MPVEPTYARQNQGAPQSSGKRSVTASSSTRMKADRFAANVLPLIDKALARRIALGREAFKEHHRDLPTPASPDRSTAWPRDQCDVIE